MPERSRPPTPFQRFAAAFGFIGFLCAVAAVGITVWMVAMLLFGGGCVFAPYADGRPGGVLGIEAGGGGPALAAAPQVGGVLGGIFGGPGGAAIGTGIGAVVAGLFGKAALDQSKKRGQAEARTAQLQGESDGWEQSEDYRLKQVGIVATTAAPVAAIAPLAPLAPVSHAPPAGAGGGVR